MDPRLSELIHNSTNSTGIPVGSYKCLFGIQSKFTITANKFGEFMNGYCNLAYEDERNDEGDGIAPYKLGIAELVEGKTTLPLMGDFHLKFHVLQCTCKQTQVLFLLSHRNTLDTHL